MHNKINGVEFERLIQEIDLSNLELMLKLLLDQRYTLKAILSGNEIDDLRVVKLLGVRIKDVRKRIAYIEKINDDEVSRIGNILST